jgi:quinol-cytochrome oxidoreductase complex cytochrome b subunit
MLNDLIHFRDRIRTVFASNGGTPPKPVGRRRYLNNLVLHFRPTTVPEASLSLTLSWGLGGMAAVLVVVQGLTGGLLNFIYEPIPSLAYESVLTIRNEVVFGKLVRNLHHWGANLLVLTGFLHLLRVFFTGAFHPPRHLTWIAGLGLMALVLLSNFTGYLLPYDQLAYWAVTICTGMLDYVPWLGPHLKALLMAGDEIGPAALKLFYTVHTTVLPISLLFLMAYHFWRVRKAGGLVVPPRAEDQREGSPVRVPAVPNLIIRELAVAAVLLAVLLLLAVLFNAPLDAPANPGLSPNPTKAPWYFAGLQELLLHFPPVLAVTAISVLAGLMLVLIPFFGEEKGRAGIWFGARRDRRAALSAMVVGGVVTLLWVLFDEYGQTKDALPAGGLSVRTGWASFLFWLIGPAGFYIGLRRWFTLTQYGAFQAVFVLLVSAFVTLTVIGIAFRGPGMRLIWPGG